MATRKKNAGADVSDLTRGFSVVVEEMRGHFGVFGEKLASLDEKVTRLDDRVTGLDDRVTAGFAQVDVRFERVEQRLGRVEIAVLEMHHELQKKVDRDEIEKVVEGVLARKSRR